MQDTKSTATKLINMSKIEINNVYKIFGNNPKSILPLVKEGKSKEQILEETGHTVGPVSYTHLTLPTNREV